MKADIVIVTSHIEAISVLPTDVIKHPAKGQLISFVTSLDFIKILLRKPRFNSGLTKRDGNTRRARCLQAQSPDRWHEACAHM